MKCPKCTSVLTDPNRCACGWKNKTHSIQRCSHSDCGLQHGLVKVSDNGRMLCAWHYTKEFDKPHLRRLAAQLKKIGLERLPNEEMKDWGARCKKWVMANKGGLNINKASSMK